jgi:Fe-S-cluster containining protein
MQRAVDWFDKSFYLEKPATKGRDLINCTRWAYGDLYDHALKEYNYTVYRRSALEDCDGVPDVAGESIFPEHISTFQLRRQFERDSFGFSAQMMNLPKAGRDTSFEKSWFRYFQAPVEDMGLDCVLIDKDDFSEKACAVEGEKPTQCTPFRWIDRAVLLDPAGSQKSVRQTEKRARNGLVAQGVDPYGRRYVFETWAGREAPDDVLRMAIKMALTWGCETIGIEEVALQEVYLPFAETLIRYEFDSVPIRIAPVSPKGRTKPQRVRGLIPLMKQGLFYFQHEVCSKLLQELVEYPHGSTVDLVDALAYGPDLLKRPQAPNEMELAYHAKQMRDAGALGQDPLTGY